MVRHLLRGLLIGGVMATVGLVCVGESRAFLGLGLCNKCQPTTVNSPVCNPCAQQMTCNYVPQTSYRVQYVSVPVTTYRPLMTCDPCGCQTTSMRAETTYVQKAQYTPYTSYKMVYTMPRPACATTAYYAPAAVAAPAGCSTCVAGGATQATYYGTTAVGATALAPQQIVAPQVAAPVTVNYTPNYAYANGYGVSSAIPSIPSAQPTIPTPGTAYAPMQQRVVVPPPPTTVVTPGVSSISPSYSGQTYVSPNGGAMAQPSLPSNTTSYYAAPGQATIVNGQPQQTQIIQSAPPVGQTQIIQTAPPVGQTQVFQSTPSPTPAPPAAVPSTIVNKPAEVETKIETKIETKVDAESTDRMQPIPDPLLNTPSGSNMNKTSTPRLYDPQDKTAAAWPIERAWGYSAVGTTVAAKPATQVVLTSAIVPGTSETSDVAPMLSTDRSSTTLGTIVPTQPAIQPIMQQQPIPVPRTRDADGWRSSNR